MGVESENQQPQQKPQLDSKAKKAIAKKAIKNKAEALFEELQGTQVNGAAQKLGETVTSAPDKWLTRVATLISDDSKPKRPEKLTDKHPPNESWPKKGHTITLNGQSLNNWEDFEKLALDDQKFFLSRLPGDAQKMVLGFLEPTRRELIQNALQQKKPTEKLEYWGSIGDRIESGQLKLPPQMWIQP